MADTRKDSTNSGKGLCCFGCHTWNNIDFAKFLTKNIKPDWWTSESKVCYRLLNQIFEVASCCKGSQEKTAHAALLALDSNLTLPSRMKNVKRKFVRLLQSKPDTSCNVTAELHCQ